MYLSGWLSDTSGNFLNLLQIKGGYSNKGGFHQKMGVPTLEETIIYNIYKIFTLYVISEKCLYQFFKFNFGIVPDISKSTLTKT